MVFLWKLLNHWKRNLIFSLANKVIVLIFLIFCKKSLIKQKILKNRTNSASSSSSFLSFSSSFVGRLAAHCQPNISPHKTNIPPFLEICYRCSGNTQKIWRKKIISNKKNFKYFTPQDKYPSFSRNMLLMLRKYTESFKI